MKKQKNRKKILLWGVGIFIVGLVALYFAGNAVIAYRAEHRRADGIAASKAGDHPKAAELLGRYLHRYPRDRYPGDRSPSGLDALSYYVVSREKAELPNGQHFADTINALKVLIGIDPDRLEDQRHLLELYAKLQR